MYDYYSAIVIRLNVVLLGASVLLCLVIILYVSARARAEARRRRYLLAIKKNVHSLVTSGQQPSDETCPVAGARTTRQFLDVELNREDFLFNKGERQFIKKCFTSTDKIASLRDIAKRSKSKWRRIEAILSLGYSEDAAAIDIIKDSLYDKDEDISYFSMLALGLIRDEAAAKILLDFMRTNIYSAYKVVSILESFPPAIVDEIIKLTGDPHPLVRSWAIKLVSKFKPEQHLAKIEELARDTSDEVRASACECLGKIGKRSAKDAIIRCLKDASWRVRAQAVRALSEVLGGQAIPEIIDLIKDDSLTVKESVKTVMASHIEATKPFIEKILKAEDELAKKELIEAIETSGYIRRLLYSTLSEDSGERSATLRLLKDMIKVSAHVGIEAALETFEEDVRGKIIDAISTIDAPFAEHVGKKLRHEISEP